MLKNLLISPFHSIMSSFSVFCKGDYSFFSTIAFAFLWLAFAKLLQKNIESILILFHFSRYLINIVNALLISGSMTVVFCGFWNASHRAYWVFKWIIRLFIAQYSILLFIFFLSVSGFIEGLTPDTVANPNTPIVNRY